MKKYFTKEIKIALTAIVAIVLLYYGISFLKGINLFKSSNTYQVEFADIVGLTVSSPVYANGYAVGIVRNIDYNYDNPGHVVVSVSLDKEMRIPEGSHAELVSSLMGGVTMNLILGANPLKHISTSDTIRGNIHMGVMDKVSELVPSVEKMLPKLDSILMSINQLLADPALKNSLHNVEGITSNLQHSTAQLNQLLDNDIPHLTNRLDRIGANVETLTGNLKGLDVAGTLARVNSTLDNVNHMTSTLDNRINSKDNSLGLLLNDRGVYDNLNNTVKSANELMVDLKAHPKRYVHFSVFGKKDK